MRHSIHRDIEGRLQERMCKDVKQWDSWKCSWKGHIGPSSKRNLGIQEKTFFDIRLTHPNVSSIWLYLEAIYESNENQKKCFYSDRVLYAVKASFTPLVFTTTDGIGKECTQFNERLAVMISEKKLKNNSPKLCATCSQDWDLHYWGLRGYRGKNISSQERKMKTRSISILYQRTRCRKIISLWFGKRDGLYCVNLFFNGK